jgi:hypothetical protein
LLGIPTARKGTAGGPLAAVVTSQFAIGSAADDAPTHRLLSVIERSWVSKRQSGAVLIVSAARLDADWL